MRRCQSMVERPGAALALCQASMLAQGAVVGRDEGLGLYREASRTVMPLHGPAAVDPRGQGRLARTDGDRSGTAGDTARCFRRSCTQGVCRDHLVSSAS